MHSAIETTPFLAVFFFFKNQFNYPCQIQMLALKLAVFFILVFIFKFMHFDP